MIEYVYELNCLARQPKLKEICDIAIKFKNFKNIKNDFLYLLQEHLRMWGYEGRSD
ncbi:hypothetical protein CE91St19_11950 [Odoribacter laneus]|jgi:hypothetical protein|nr:hypothetical protein CE91St19_11950 [Odoribacter laneus]GKI26375.1 hypothetical protein CE91St20_25120 [Odoribacter laneus]